MFCAREGRHPVSRRSADGGAAPLGCAPPQLVPRARRLLGAKPARCEAAVQVVRSWSGVECRRGGADIAWVGAPRAKDCRMNRVRNPDRVTPFPAHRLRQNKRTGGLSLNLLLLYSSFSEGKRFKASPSNLELFRVTHPARARRPAPRFVCCKLRVVTFYHLCNISQKLGLRRHVTVTVWCNCNCKRQRRTPPSPHPQTERALPHTALRELQNPRRPASIASVPRSEIERALTAD